MATDRQFIIRAAVRRRSSRLTDGISQLVTGELTQETQWAEAMAETRTVVHLAARVHVMREAAADPLTEFRKINVAGTLNLARQAAGAGVRRFVYLSSVKVNGEAGGYTENDRPVPEDPYGVSKHEAEVGLLEIAAETGMEVVIIRPPLVYGPGVRANFRALARAVGRGLPLPLGAIRNRRSLIALDNLVDFILVCMTHPAAANEIFLISDGEDLSTPELVRRLARAMGRPARLIPVPPVLLLAAAALFGKREIATRLVQSLQVDISKARRLLGWSPPITVDEGLRRIAMSL
jgi:UDP-glucose 4-epimerase